MSEYANCVECGKVTDCKLQDKGKTWNGSAACQSCWNKAKSEGRVGVGMNA